MSVVDTDEVVRLTTVKPVSGGDMLAWHDGRTFMVAGALPEEDVTVKILGTTGKVVRAQVVEVHTPHPHRTDKGCPAAQAGAGCCSYHMASADLQRSMKKAIMEDQWRRIAHWDPSDLPFEVTWRSLDSRLTGWRTTARWSVHQGVIGYRGRRSHHLIPLREQWCTQLHPDFRELVEDSGLVIPPSVTDIHVARGADEECYAIGYVQDSAPSTQEKRGRGRGNRRGRRAPSQQQPLSLWNGTHVPRQALDHVWMLPVDSFWQAHEQAAQMYAQLVCDDADLQPEEDAWDLYGGCGVFAHALAVSQPDYGSLVSVDVSAAAACAGREVMGDRTTFFTQPVDEWLREHAVDCAPSTVVADPPRTGIGEYGIHTITALGPRTVLHFGCESAAFVRDLALWTQHGYTVERVEIFDAFPGTHHMEGFAKLHRTP